MYFSSFCVIFSSLIVINHADPINPELTLYEIENDGLGTSRFVYAINDGTYHGQNIKTLNIDKGNNKHFGKGSYSYQKHNIVTSVTYEADDNGFRPHVKIFTLIGQEQHFPTNAIITLQGGGIGYLDDDDQLAMKRVHKSKLPKFTHI